jgi:hypothetical protein
VLGKERIVEVGGLIVHSGIPLSSRSSYLSSSTKIPKRLLVGITKKKTPTDIISKVGGLSRNSDII